MQTSKKLTLGLHYLKNILVSQLNMKADYKLLAVSIDRQSLQQVKFCNTGEAIRTGSPKTTCFDR